jgi:uncharacterized membrane protein
MSKKNGFTVKKMAVAGVLGGISAVLGLTPLGFIPIGPTRATIMHIPVIIGAIMEGPLVGALVGLIFGFFSMFQAVMNPTPVSFVFLNPLVSVVPRILIGIVSYYVYILFKKLGDKASKATLFAVWGGTVVYLVLVLFNSIKTYGNAETSIWSVILNIVLIISTLILGYYSYKKVKQNAVELVISAAAGTLTNTAGVLSTIYFIYAEEFAVKMEIDPNAAGKFILGIGISNGIPEVIVAMIIVTSVVASLKKRA